MKIVARYAVTLAAASALLAGCGGSQPPLAPSGKISSPISQSAPAAYTSLYSFQAKPDGQNPEARVIPFGDALYGTTAAGGKGCGGKGCGVVFQITKSGTESVLHRFAGRPDGARPLAELAVAKNELYGATYIGGARCRTARVAGCGTVFAIDSTGKERVIYSFKGVPDGANPQGPLILVNGTLYGTTAAGGASCPFFPAGCGTVYSIDASGRERVLYRFAGKPNDGSLPTGNLVYLNGKLYGTTMGGGPVSWGTVFSMTLSGNERVLYTPAGGSTSLASPSGLVAMDGVLYGSAIAGGQQSGGVVYAVTTSGSEHIVHGFSQNKERNGNRPLGRLIVVGGVLYGTTRDGGQEHSGYGTVFSLTASGQLRILYWFKGPPDGAGPYSGISDAKGTFYGTTVGGGTGCYHYGCQGGYGTVFRLTH